MVSISLLFPATLSVSVLYLREIIRTPQLSGFKEALLLNRVGMGLAVGLGVCKSLLRSMGGGGGGLVDAIVFYFA